MALHLRLAAAKRNKHAESEKLARFHIKASARVIVAEAIAREELLDVQLILGRGILKTFDHIAADNLLLDRKSLSLAVLWRRCGLAGQRKRDSPLGQHLVRGVNEIERLGHANIGHGLIDDLFDLDWRDPDIERRP